MGQKNPLVERRVIRTDPFFTVGHSGIDGRGSPPYTTPDLVNLTLTITPFTPHPSVTLE